MESCVILHPVGNSPIQTPKKTSHSAAHAGKRSPGAYGRRRSLRLSSVRTGIEHTQNLKIPTNPRRRLRETACQPLLPLSEPRSSECGNTSQCSLRQSLGTAVHPPTAAEAMNVQSTKRIESCLVTDKYASKSVDSDRSYAHLLLSQARQSVELEMDWLGRKPYVMDIILDLKAQAQNINYTPNGPTDALLPRIQGHVPNLLRLSVF